MVTVNESAIGIEEIDLNRPAARLDVDSPYNESTAPCGGEVPAVGQ
jgi:hypothetical protein